MNSLSNETPWFEFDINYYKEANKDIFSLSDEEMATHFKTIGVRTGRAGSSFALREHFLELVDTSTPVLEIGPFCSPLLVGENVFYFDVMPVESLLERAQRVEYPTSRCPNEIHYVSPSGDISTINAQFNSLISSHNIEHQFNLVKHLQDASSILTDDGKYYLIIPDKRFCFDHYLPDSRTVDIIDAYVNERTKHTLCNVIEHRAYMTHNDPLRHWKDDHGPHPELNQDFLEKLSLAVSEFNSSGDNYIDVHAWKFTPESFYGIINNLHKLRHIPFYVEKIFNTPYGRFEFCVVLTKG